MVKLGGIALVVLAAALSLLGGCTVMNTTRSASGDMGSRELSATATGTRVLSLEVDPTTNRGIVVLDSHKVVVEGDSVLVDGKQVMTLAPQSQKVEITYKSGRVTISDGIGPAQNLRL